jgi:DNA-binding IscR family transcriptional regulator
MSRDSKLSGVLHLLLHLGESETPLTSEQLGAMNQTNPVVIRRLLAGLREGGLVASEKGHGGGWILAKNLESLSVADVYRALGAPALFQFQHRNESPTCLLEKAVNFALDDARAEAEAVLLKRLSQIPLSALAEQVKKHAAKARSASASKPKTH